MNAKGAANETQHNQEPGELSKMETTINELYKCKLQWKSTTLLVLRHPSGDSKLEYAIRNEVSVLNSGDLLEFSERICQSTDQTVETGDLIEIYYRVLKIASLSILEHAASHEAVGENIIQIWLENSRLLYIINALFDEQREDIAEHKKLALDLGFVIVSRMLYFGGPSFGLASPVKQWISQLLLIFGKLLESFMVTTPPHFPFMPAQHFATIRWPVVVQESCSGKVHSLVTFLPVTSQKSSVTADTEDRSSESSTERKDDVKYCNFEVVARRQPWKEMVSALQLYQLVQLLMDYKAAASSDDATSVENHNALATATECEEVLYVLRSVFQRIANVDPALLCRDPLKTAPILTDDACCCPATATSIPTSVRANPFAAFTRTVLGLTVPAITAAAGSGTAKMRCRLCGEVTCPACAAESTWMDGRVCTNCYPLLQELALLHLRPKKSRLLNVSSAASTERSVVFAVPTFAAIAGRGGTMGAGGPGGAGCADDEVEGGEEGGEDGRYSPCCSETMTDSLRSWRDGAETDDDDI